MDQARLLRRNCMVAPVLCGPVTKSKSLNSCFELINHDESCAPPQKLRAKSEKDGGWKTGFFGGCLCFGTSQRHMDSRRNLTVGMGGLTFEQVLARAKAMLGVNTLVLTRF